MLLANDLIIDIFYRLNRNTRMDLRFAVGADVALLLQSTPGIS